MLFCLCLLCCQLISNLQCLSDNCFGRENVNHIIFVRHVRHPTQTNVIAHELIHR